MADKKPIHIQPQPQHVTFKMGPQAAANIVEIDPNFEPQARCRSNTWPLRQPEFTSEKEEGEGYSPLGTENFIIKEEPAELCSGGVEMQPGSAVLLSGPSSLVCSPGTAGSASPISPVDVSVMSAAAAAAAAAKKNTSRRNAWGNMSYADLITKAIEGSDEKRLTLSQIYDWMVRNVPYFRDKGDSNSSAGWKNSIRHNLSLHNRFMRVQNEGTGKSSWWVINPDAKPGKSSRRRATSMEAKSLEKKRGRAKKKVELIRAGLLEARSPSTSSLGEDTCSSIPDSPLHPFQLSPEFRPRTSSNASSCGRLSPIHGTEPDLHDNQVPPMSPIPWSDYSSCATVPEMDQYTDDHLTNTLVESMNLNGSLSSLNTSDSGYVNDKSPSPNHMQMVNHHALVTNNGTVGPPQYHIVNNKIAVVRRSPQNIVNTGVGYNGVSIQSMNTKSIGMSNNQDPMVSSAFQNHQLQQFGNETMLRTVLAHKQQQIQQARGNRVLASASAANSGGGLLSIPSDLDFTLMDVNMQEDLECDVDQVINHELSMDDGGLDFNFDGVSSNHQPVATTTSSNLGGT